MKMGHLYNYYTCKKDSKKALWINFCSNKEKWEFTYFVCLYMCVYRKNKIKQEKQLL